MVCLILYGWMTKVRSHRAMERACRDSLAFIWLTGNNPPDHNTISRFFKKHTKQLSKLFGETVKFAASLNMIAMVVNALDGTKIPAVCSTETGDHKAKLDRRAAKLDKAIEETLEKIRREMEETGDDVPDDRLPEELADKQRLRAAIEEKRKQLEEQGRKHSHPGEPDAEVMKCRRAGNQFAYNAQAVVDSKHGVLIAQQVVTAQNDQEQLVPMLEKVEETVGQRAEETVADAGYHTGTAIHQAERAGFNVLVNEPGRAERTADGVDLRASRFTFDRERDTCQCPTGRHLDFEGTRRNKQGIEVRVFRCHHSAKCALAAVCSTDKRGRSIEVAPFHDAVVRQRMKREIPEKREIVKKRGALIERFFAYTKAVTGFTRFTLRGLEGASTQWSLHGAAYNLKLIMKHSDWIPVPG